MKPGVLIIGKVDQNEESFIRFSNLFNIILYNFKSKSLLIHDFNTIYKTTNISALWLSHGEFDLDLYNSLPKDLKCIVLCSIGYDRYDLNLLKKKNIILCNRSNLGSNDVADLTLYHTLSAFRFFPIFEKNLRLYKNTIDSRLIMSIDNDNNSSKSNNKYFALGDQCYSQLVHSPKNKIAGIVGLGQIGKQIAIRLNSLGMSLHYHQRNKLSPSNYSLLIKKFIPTNNNSLPLTYHQDLSSLLKISDIIILALPLNNNSLNLINKDNLSLCKENVKIINISRGKIINEQDVIDFLDQGKIGYLSLDVFHDENNINKRLIFDKKNNQRYNVSLTPHIGSSTYDQVLQSYKLCQDNIIDIVLNDGNGLSPVNA
ncbi:putative hydroxyacid dehydrogenase [Ascoidea rubescens DSM 1968]|uniref:NAD(P)-binding protein n=1 Tax=Ascoidea rubescens DSM 1968 TaxID=1344418 RepID=A0A1D2VBP9_9ASCO|nr:NAD(P)-binding protein [Ascoidea rubescens DSM 1968]ODV58887.1 NAD(P)-binding protein [Ascoidea rubescens DSM 1968]